jgi:hypothetical protein
MNYRVFLFAALAGLNACISANDENIGGATFTRGYYNLYFLDDHSIQIYQSSSGSFARGCGGSGNWVIENGKVRVSIYEGNCATETYQSFNGLYNYSGDCIKQVDGKWEFCKDY